MIVSSDPFVTSGFRDPLRPRRKTRPFFWVIVAAVRTQTMQLTKRLDGIDALRGAAIVWMTLFHFCFDLNHAGFIRQDFYSDPFWTWQRSAIVSLFLKVASRLLRLCGQTALKPVRLEPPTKAAPQPQQLVEEEEDSLSAGFEFAVLTEEEKRFFAERAAEEARRQAEWEAELSAVK